MQTDGAAYYAGIDDLVEQHLRHDDAEPDHQRKRDGVRGHMNEEERGVWIGVGEDAGGEGDDPGSDQRNSVEEAGHDTQEEGVLMAEEPQNHEDQCSVQGTYLSEAL